MTRRAFCWLLAGGTVLWRTLWPLQAEARVRLVASAVWEGDPAGVEAWCYQGRTKAVWAILHNGRGVPSTHPVLRRHPHVGGPKTLEEQIVRAARLWAEVGNG